MNIKSLTINGFKSFGKKTVFDFNKSITAIVGPNGSGKSNITEAMRFVLGEQSFKSIRTKEVTDLLFRGADSSANMLSVSIIFDKIENLKTENLSVLIQNIIEKSEIEISRIVYADGKNLYKINNQEVRLKDVQELLMILSIGSKNSWHISQGESDKILLATTEARSEIIEDALGLRIYHSKINEAEKKLEKSQLNIREVFLQRKEIMPEITLLSRQIEKIEKVKIYKQDLLIKWQEFYHFKNKSINSIKVDLDNFKNIEELDLDKNNIVRQIVLLEKSHQESGSNDVAILQNKKVEEENLLSIVKSKKENAEKEKRETENILNYLKIEIDKNNLEIQNIILDLNKLTLSGNEILFKENDLLSLKTKLQNIQNGSNLNMAQFSDLVQSLVNEINSLLSKGMLVSKDDAKEISYLNNIKNRVEEKLKIFAEEKKESEHKLKAIIPELDNLNLQVKILNQNIENLHIEILEFKFKGSELERDVEKLKLNILEIDNKIEKIHRLNFILQEEEDDLDTSKYEVQKIFGQNFNLSKIEDGNKNDLSKLEMHDLEKNIERLKIKIEDSQVVSGDEIAENYKNLKERDEYLQKEILDLEKSISNLKILIKDLKDRLKTDFETGVKAINNFFDIYVKKLFGGGLGRIFITNKAKKNNLENVSESESDFMSKQEDKQENKDEQKVGLEVEVELPKKKVKSLHALSGGERALVSIALTVAILQNNPSPFMILDEADATLDEANARRYGELLELIKEKTKLIVVTHNRETMSFADEVYGITLEKSGASKVLSVSFDDALSYAK